MTAASCPVCGGAKSKRARMCARCRRRANALGGDVLQQVPTALPKPRHVPRTPQQNIVYHAKCSDLAALDYPHVTPAEHKLHVLEVKQRALEHASKRSGRQIESSTELSETEMELLLEWLDVELKRRLPAAAIAEA